MPPGGMIIPVAPLAPGASYTRDGDLRTHTVAARPLARVWSFTTALRLAAAAGAVARRRAARRRALPPRRTRRRCASATPAVRPHACGSRCVAGAVARRPARADHDVPRRAQLHGRHVQRAPEGPQARGRRSAASPLARRSRRRAGQGPDDHRARADAGRSSAPAWRTPRPRRRPLGRALSPAAGPRGACAG